MRQLLPTPLTGVDLRAAYAYPTDVLTLPWVRANMVSSLDGAAVVDGRSGALGGAGDKDVFAVPPSCAVSPTPSSSERAPRASRATAPCAPRKPMRRCAPLWASCQPPYSCWSPDGSTSILIRPFSTAAGSERSW
jgi:hypothetical protein